MHTLILGATGGIGAATARAFAAAGHTLILSGRDETRLAALASELGATGRVADVGFESHVRTLLEAAPELDTLVYAAGAALPEPLRGALLSACQAACAPSTAAAAVLSDAS